MTSFIKYINRFEIKNEEFEYFSCEQLRRYFFSALSFVRLVPAYTHTRVGNTGTCVYVITHCGQQLWRWRHAINWFVLFSNDTHPLLHFTHQFEHDFLFNFDCCYTSPKEHREREKKVSLILFRIHWVWTEQWQFPIFVHNFWMKKTTQSNGFHKFNFPCREVRRSSRFFFHQADYLLWNHVKFDARNWLNALIQYRKFTFIYHILFEWRI